MHAAKEKLQNQTALYVYRGVWQHTSDLLFTTGCRLDDTTRSLRNIASHVLTIEKNSYSLKSTPGEQLCATQIITV